MTLPELLMHPELPAAEPLPQPPPPGAPPPQEPLPAGPAPEPAPGADPCACMDGGGSSSPTSPPTGCGQWLEVEGSSSWVCYVQTPAAYQAQQQSSRNTSAHGSSSGGSSALMADPSFPGEQALGSVRSCLISDKFGSEWRLPCSGPSNGRPGQPGSQVPEWV